MFALHMLAFALATAAVPPQPQAPTPGKVCIALLLPAVDGVDDATAVATSVRSIFESYLTGPTLQSVMLDAKLASQANQEAKQKECPRILTVTVSRKAGSTVPSKAGTIARAAGTTAAYIPMPGVGSVAEVAAQGNAQQMLVADPGDPAFLVDHVALLVGEEHAWGAEEFAEKAGSVELGEAGDGHFDVSDLAYRTHAKDEITMTYKVVTADGATVMPLKTESAKAKSAGEDLLTPLIAKAADAVAGVITR